MLAAREDLLKEFTFKTSRSGGKGGQHVNKVSSKVELIFNIQDCIQFSPEEKELLVERLKNKIDQEGNLHIIAQADRSQLVNKEDAIEKCLDLLRKSLVVQKKRKPTKIPKAIVQKRLNDKLVIAQRKQARKKPSVD